MHSFGGQMQSTMDKDFIVMQYVAVNQFLCGFNQCEDQVNDIYVL